MAHSLSGLYAITPTGIENDDALLQKVDAVLKGGCRLVQYRDKSRDATRRYRQAMALRQMCSRRNALLIVNDDIDLALAVNAGGVHLGQDDVDIYSARCRAPSHFVIGATCHNRLDLAEIAQQKSADYLAFGRFFSSQTKASAAPADIDIIAAAKAQFVLPLVAIGGITVDNAPLLISRGANCVAVSHDLFQYADLPTIRERTQQYCRLFSG